MLRSSWVIAVSVLSWLAVVSQSVQAEVRRPKIESVEGAKSVLLQRGLELREAAIGEEIFAGERVRTDEKTTVIVAYADGSHLTVNPGSDLEIEESKGKVQGNLLRSGLVRGAVNKEKTSGNGQSKKIHFVIRTKTAVMGVRGTEFVAAFNELSGISQFNTLEGAVEVANNPTALMGGNGVSVSGGQFVQASASGISDVQPFNRTEFLNSIGSSSGSSASSSGLSTLASSAAARAKAAVDAPAQSNPPPPPPPKLPMPPEPPAAVVAQKKKEETERERPTWHLIAFSAGALMTETPLPENGRSLHRAVALAWTPSLPVPGVPFLVLRGSFGGSLFEMGSLNNNFLIRELQGLVAFTLLRPLYLEAGFGRQYWAREQISAPIFSLNAGIILSENGRLNRIFVGTSTYQGEYKAMQVRAGIGFQL